MTQNIVLGVIAGRQPETGPRQVRENGRKCGARVEEDKALNMCATEGLTTNVLVLHA